MTAASMASAKPTSPWAFLVVPLPQAFSKMKDAAIAIANDRAGITQGDCSALMSEVGTYFDRAASAVG